MRLIVIMGPTASGKTRLAAEVAHRLGTEVISADSRQVYRDLDIGTGKDLEEFLGYSPAVPVHLIDQRDVMDLYSLYEFKRDVIKILKIVP